MARTQKQKQKQKQQQKTSSRLLSQRARTLVALRMLKSAHASEKGAALDLLSDNGIHRICESVKNTLFCKRPLGAAKKDKLRKLLAKHTPSLRVVANRDVPVSRKRRLLKQQSGGFISAILGVALPLLIQIIASAVSK
jgi:hypothetical protein